MMFESISDPLLREQLRKQYAEALVEKKEYDARGTPAVEYKIRPLSEDKLRDFGEDGRRW